jgi:dihydropteroate synthase
MQWRHATGLITLDKPRILGIVNVTPDSFSDGGQLKTVDDARRLIDTMIADGVDIVDIGGESSRPQGATPVTPDDELRRVIPAIEACVKDHPGTPVSVDTVKAVVANHALAAGASIVNDVSAFRLDAGMPMVCARGGAGVVLMHSRGDISDMATFAHATYDDDPLSEILTELRSCIAVAERGGIDRERIVVDPGIGFAKRGWQSLAVLGQLERVVELGYPVLVGVSRKRFIGEISGTPNPADRLPGTLAANVTSLERGARLFRVHDVRPARQALDVAWAIMQRGRQ